MLDIAGVLEWNVACMRLTVANRRATDQSRRFISGLGAIVLGDPARDVALPTVCAIVARLPSSASNTTILIKFRMIRSRKFGVRSLGAGRTVRDGGKPRRE
jgi:hypothetical protein